MKMMQYVRAERAIVGADSGGIQQRWLYGLRLLADPEAMTPGNGLRHGKAEKLVATAQARGLTLSQREIQFRLQCARTYPTESQIRSAASRFGTWRDLCDARFPPIEADPGDPPADFRTASERDHERAQQLLVAVGGQGTLFPDFEPDEATLKDLMDYAEQQDLITERFAQRGRERRTYLDELTEAVGYDLSQTWQEAHRRAFGDDPT